MNLPQAAEPRGPTPVPWGCLCWQPVVGKLISSGMLNTTNFNACRDYLDFEDRAD